MSKLILPRHLQEKPAYQCRICNTRFFEDEKPRYERHVVKCAHKHRDTIEAASPKQGLAEKDFEHDLELEAFMRRYR